jgi:hypothetical protein
MSDHYAAVFEALDAAVAGSASLASSEASIQRALVEFRKGRNDPAAIKQLEEVSLDLHRLSNASIGNQQAERAAALERLRQAADRWIERLPLH